MEKLLWRKIYVDLTGTWNYTENIGITKPLHKQKYIIFFKKAHKKTMKKNLINRLRE